MNSKYEDQDLYMDVCKEYIEKKKLDINGKIYLYDEDINGEFEHVHEQEKPGELKTKGLQWVTLLCYGIYCKHKEVVEYLLKKKADPNIYNRKDDKYYYPLELAIENNSYNLLKLLLDNKADPNLNNSLMTATSNKAYHSLKLLIEYNADLNRKYDGFTSLFISIFNNDTSCAMALLNKKADPNIPVIDSSPGDKLSHPYSERPELYETYPLFYAINHNNNNLVKMLLNAKADPDNGNRTECPIFTATAMGNTSSLRLLCQAKASINKYKKCTNCSCYPHLLYQASENGHNSIVRYLIGKKADIEETYEGKTALYTVCKYGNLSVLKTLVKAKADINTYKYDSLSSVPKNITALYTTILHGNYDCMDYLLDQEGIEPDLYTNGRGHNYEETSSGQRIQTN